MSILWCGGEDIDFLDSGAVGLSTSSSYCRSTYARCSISASGAFRYSAAFAGGTVTSCWMSCYFGLNYAGTAGRFIGLVSSATGSSVKGLWIGTSSNDPARITINKYDGSTMTVLATSSQGYYAGNTATVCKIDVQLISYGASATVNVYVNGGLSVTFSGDVTVSGVSNVDAVAIGGIYSNYNGVSEIIVADVDTRSLSLMTMAPASDGTTNQWTAAASDINETTNSDATVANTNTTNDVEQYNITDLPTGTFAVVAVKAAARAAMSAGSTPTGLKLGVNSGGTQGLGSTKTPAVSFGLAEEIFSTNPATSAAWAQSEMNALQIELKAV